MRIAVLLVHWPATLLHQNPSSKLLLGAYPHVLPCLQCINTVDDFFNCNGDQLLGKLTQVSFVCISQYFV